MNALRQSGTKALVGILVLVAARACPATRPQGPEPGRIVYRLDLGASSMVMHTFTEGVLSAFAPNYTFAFTWFAGEVTLTPGTLAPATFFMRTLADSVRLLDEASVSKRRERERMLREEIFETDRYPTMIYRSTSIALARDSQDLYRAELEGVLTQHGVTRPCPMTVSARFAGGSGSPGDSLVLRGEFSILQTDYGMRPTRFLFGTVRVENRVVIAFELVARRE